MPAGRPQIADPGVLYAVAHQLYWDLRRVAEGNRRLRIDEKEYKHQIAEQEAAIEETPQELKRIAARVDREISEGRLRPSMRQKRIRELKNQGLRGVVEFMAQENARKEIKVPGEPDVIQALMSPDLTPGRIREICNEAVMKRRVEAEPGVFKEIDMPAWPISAGSPLLLYLSEHAEQYVAALHDPRFPSCDISARPSTRLKQFWFLARALAGAVCSVKTRTAINLVGSLRPEEVFEHSRYAKPRRKHGRRK